MELGGNPNLGYLNTFQGRFIALRQQMFADGIHNELPFSDKDLQTLDERSKSEGISFIKVTLPLLGKAFDTSLVTGRFSPISNFASKRDTCLPKLFYPVFRLVLHDDGTLLSKPNILAIFYLRQILLFDAKLITEPTQAQKDQAISGFRQRQDDLRKKRVPVEHPVIIIAQRLLSKVLKDLDLSTISPGHGPGGVAEGFDRFERWNFTFWPAKAERVYSFIEYGTQSPRMTLELGNGIPLRKKMVTKCCLVPKDFRGPRLISAEPTVNQYLQQGQMKALMQYIKNHRFIRRSLKLQDQTYNQRMAKDALGNDQITLDLSNASDTVSTTLVWHLLSGVPRLRRQLMCTRSDFLSFQGEEVKLVAFAPMGSAVCFPVESLVFWSLSLASIIHSSPSRSRDGFEYLSSLAVFGDDIIIPSFAKDTLIGTLRDVGCEPNMSKTCFSTPFRESCGTEWYSGSDVTLIRNRRYYYDNENKLSNHPVLCDLQRKFFLRGLYKTADLLQQWAREIYPVATVSIDTFRNINPKLLSNDDRRGGFSLSRCQRLAIEFDGTSRSLFEDDEDSSYFERQSVPFDSYPACIGWANEIDSRLPVRFNRGYQRMEFRAPLRFKCVKSWVDSGYPRLLARLVGDQTERIAIRDLRIKLAWSVLPFPSLLSKRGGV